MNLYRVLLMLSVSFAVSCAEKENPYRMEMDGLLHENKLLNVAMQKTNEAIQKADYQRFKLAELATLLQVEKEKLEAELTTMRQRVEELSAKNDDLNVKLGVITEREREANARIRAVENKKVEAKHLEDVNRQQLLAAITAANQPSLAPFRVFDEMFIGKKEINGRLQDAGRLSIRNYTDQPLEVRIEDFALGIRVQIPANSASNVIYVAARRGEQISIRGAGHIEKITW